MPSAWPDKRGYWIVEFTGLHRKRRTVRVPADRLARAGNDDQRRALALGFAIECETYIGLIQTALTARVLPHIDHIEHARAIGALTRTQAAQLLGDEPPSANPRIEPGRLTIRDAWAQHASTQREDKRSPAEHRRHTHELDKYLTWSGHTYLDEITLPAIERYVAHLEDTGGQFDGIRHALIPLRRACAVAPRHGLIDPLASYRQPRDLHTQRARIRETDIYTADQLATLLRRIEPQGPRLTFAFAVQAFLGLRPSEARELRLADLSADATAIHTGRKNRYSIRTLPLPATLQTWAIELRDTAENPSPDTALIRPIKSAQPQRGYRAESTFSAALGRALNDTGPHARDYGAPTPEEKANHKAPPPIVCGRPWRGAKYLRKSFATLAIFHLGLEPSIVESYLGHSQTNLGAIANRHYLAQAALEKLKPASEKLEDFITQSLHPRPTPITRD